MPNKAFNTDSVKLASVCKDKQNRRHFTPPANAALELENSLIVSLPMSKFEIAFARLWMGAMVFLTVMVLVFFDSFWLAIGSLFMLVIGGYLFHRTVWCVANEVIDLGDTLAFKKGKVEQVVSVNNIVRLSHPFSNFKGLICVHLKDRSSLGKTLTFKVASSSSSRFTATKLYNDLSNRVIRANES